jgi:prepilin-type N-terminal cleavage/methylation domain-containing protein
MKRIIKYLYKENGFTLLELIMVIVIMGIMALVMTGIIGTQAQSFVSTFNSSSILHEGRRTIDMLRSDLHGLSADNINTMDADHLIFTDSDGNTLDYELSDSTLSRNGTITARFLKQNPFSYLDIDQSETAVTADVVFIKITLDFERYNEYHKHEEIVYLRN